MERTRIDTYPGIVKLTQDKLDSLSRSIEKRFSSDVIYFNSQIDKASIDVLTDVVLQHQKKSGLKTLTFLIDTPGGNANLIINFIELLRSLYEKINFVVPKYAISAGTFLCLSGNEIYLNSRSALVPIDLQLETDRKYAFNLIRKQVAELEESIKMDSANPNNGNLYHKLTNLRWSYNFTEQLDYQENINHLTEKYLKLYLLKDNGVSNIDEVAKQIPNRLSDYKDMIEYGIYDHDSKILFEKAKRIGIPVKNYEVTFPEITDAIEQFVTLCNDYSAFTGHKNFTLYSRITDYIPNVTEIPKQENTTGK